MAPGRWERNLYSFRRSSRLSTYCRRSRLCRPSRPSSRHYIQAQQALQQALQAPQAQLYGVGAMEQMGFSFQEPNPVSKFEVWFRFLHFQGRC